MTLELRNPHSVLAALQSRPQDVLEVRISSAQPHGAWRDVVELARRAGRPVSLQTPAADRRRKETHRSEKSRRAGIAEARVRERSGVSLDELFRDAGTRDEGRGVWLALDHVQDPQNVGAIVRTAAFCGAAGIIVTRDQSAPLNGVVYDVASGGMEYIPCSVQTNLARSLEFAKQAGVWVLGTSEHAEHSAASVDRDRPWLLVVGNEENGLRRLTLENCDQLCRLPSRGQVGSLNVSVATGMMLALLRLAE